MDILDHFKRLFAYDAWANRESANSLKRADTVSERTRGLFAHIIAAEWLWLERLTDRKSSLPVWPELSLEECEAECIKVSGEMRGFLDSLSLSDLDKQVFYTNSKGEPWQSSVADILTHVAMHSAYHRGQIAGQLREAGAGPANTDFIHCARQGLID